MSNGEQQNHPTRMVVVDLERVRRHFDCTRCGICCMIGPCSFGEGEPCKHLSFDGDVAICALIENGTLSLKQRMFGKGCDIKKIEHIYNYYLESRKPVKEQLQRNGVKQ